jgi:hypothetical protein
MAASAIARVRHGMISVGGVGVLVGGMAAIDDTVRGALVDIFNGRLPIAVTVPDMRIQDVPRMLTTVIGLPSGSQLPLLSFGVVGLVLVIFMFRS